MDYKMRIPHKLFLILARKILGTITSVSTQEPVAALTFDDGPHPEFTSRLLDILETHNARATFFMLGEAARSHPELVRRVAEAGHAIGNHSWDHPNFPLLTGRERRRQMCLCEKAISPYGHCLFRPPFGYQSVRSRLDALWLRYQVVTWNLHAEDWLGRDAGWMTRRLLSEIKPGSIILLHDALFPPPREEGYANREPTLEAVTNLLAQLRDRYRFITVPELFRHGRPEKRNWYWKLA